MSHWSSLRSKAPRPCCKPSSRPVSEKIFGHFYLKLTTALVCNHEGIDVGDKRDTESIRVALSMCAASVRRVVVTSSIRSVFGFADEHPPGYVYTEEDWNTKASLENNQGYALSKLLGEVSICHGSMDAPAAFCPLLVHPWSG